MTYNSLGFLAFFAIFLIIYLLMPNARLRQAVILIGNLIFYKLAGSFKLLAIVLTTSVIVYTVSRCIERIYAGYDEEKTGHTPKEQAVIFASYKKRSKKYLVAGIVLIVGMLFVVKIGKLLNISSILIPVGISYYTFSSIGYLLDIYWKKAKCEHNYLKLLLCMTYFPHIVQGPIGRYDKLLKQFDALPSFSYERVCFGLQRMVWGYFKKIVVADRIALYTSTIFGAPAEYAGAEIGLAVVLCAVELYADFSGCMDIVCGAAQTMGMTLDENFKRPFFSKSAAEFWRRWHITLGTWFKDYIYMPIAMSPRFMKFAVNIRKKHGNRAGQIVSSAIPLAVVWLLTGLWHGTGSDYIVWGCYWGGLIILGTVLAPEFKKINTKLNIDVKSFGFRFFQMARTFLIFCGGRMLTVTGSLSGFIMLVKGLLSEHRLWIFFDGSIYNYGLDQKNFMVVVFGIVLMWAVDMLQEKMNIRETLAKQPLVFRWLIYYSGIVLVLIYGMYGSAYDAASFVYGGF